MKVNDITQFITSPTHHRCTQTPSLIDLVLSNDAHTVCNISHFPPFGLSHHSVLCFSTDFSPHVVESAPILKYQIDKGDYIGMRSYMSKSKEQWDNELMNTNVDSCWEIIDCQVNTAKDMFIPKKMYKNNTVKRPFTAPPTLIERVRLKRKAFKYYKKFPTTRNYNMYVRYRNQVKWECRKAKRLREHKLAKDAKSNPKAFFQYVKSKTKQVESISNLVKADGTLTENDKEKAEVLNEFFGSVFTSEDVSNVPVFIHSNENILSDFSVREEEMRTRLRALKVSKSPGPDGIHPRILRELSDELAYPLTVLLNKSLVEGRLPTAWKTAEVRPIFKKGAKSSPGNYRPVSLTSVVCKVFEGFIRDQMYDHMINNNILSKNQYGFCKGRSCITQLLSTIHDWFQYLDRGIPVDAIYLDFRKAFDTVPHKRLLSKLWGYGVRGQVLKWVEDFLSDRYQYVSVNDKTSQKIPVTSGVPQGSVLGPVLFIYFINDLPDVIQCVSRIFADDTKAYDKAIDDADFECIQNSIDAMVKWGDKWLSFFNTEKCKSLHLGKSNTNHVYTMTVNDVSTPLGITECEKDLGVYVDSNLNFNEHISTIMKKAKNMCYMIIRTISFKSPDIMLPLYKALVRPSLEYGNPVWCPFKKKDIDDLEDIQRFFTKCIIACSHLSYEDRLRKLKLPSLSYRRLRGDMIEVFKITHKIYDPESTKSLFDFAVGSTRNNGFKIVKKHTNTTAYQHFFTNRVVNYWNGLPRHVVNVDSVNSFKNALDCHYSHIMFDKRVDHDVVQSLRA